MGFEIRLMICLLTASTLIIVSSFLKQFSDVLNSKFNSNCYFSLTIIQILGTLRFEAILWLFIDVFFFKAWNSVPIMRLISCILELLHQNLISYALKDWLRRRTCFLVRQNNSNMCSTAHMSHASHLHCHRFLQVF